MGKKIGLGLAAVLIVAVVVGAFFVIKNKSNDAESSTQITEIGDLTSMDLESEENYPASPRAVVNLYSRFLTAMYNEDYTDEQFDDLIMNMRKLMDDELLANNPEDQYRQSMKADAQKYKENKWTLVNYTMPDSDEVIYKEVQEKECAILTASYFIKQNTAYAKTFQNYMLRKDDEGKWKILSYALKSTEEVDANGEEIEGDGQ